MASAEANEGMAGMAAGTSDATAAMRDDLENTAGSFEGMQLAARDAAEDVQDKVEQAAGSMPMLSGAAEDASADVERHIEDAAASMPIISAGAEDASRDMAQHMEDAAASVPLVSDASEKASRVVKENLENAAGAFGGLSGASHTAEEHLARDALSMEGHGSRITGMFEHMAKSSSSIPVVGSIFEHVATSMKATDAAGKGLEGTMSKVGMITSYVGVTSLAAFGAAAVDLGSKFQESMTELVTGAGQSKAGLAQVESGILSMSGTVGQSAEDLASGMYLVESAGYHGARGLDVLKAAAEGARVGAAPLPTVADAVTSALNAYAIPATKAVNVTNELIATVAAGKMHMDDLAGSLGSVLPVAAAAHISFAQVGGAIATMTAMGMSAHRATMNLATTIRSLESPNATAVKEMEALGINSTKLSMNLGKEGLSGTMDELTEAILKHMGPAGTVLLDKFAASQSATSDLKTMFDSLSPSAQKLAKSMEDGKETTNDLTKAEQAMSPVQAEQIKQFEALLVKSQGFNSAITAGTPQAQTFAGALQKVTGNAQAMQVALLTTGTHAATMAANVASVQRAADGSSKAVAGWSDVQQDLSYQVASAKDAIEAFATKIGLVLIPVLEKMLGAFSHVITFILGHKDVLIALGVLIGGFLSAAVAVFVEQKLVKMAHGFQAAFQDAKKLEQGLASLAQKYLGLGQTPAPELSPTSPVNTEDTEDTAEQTEQVQALSDAAGAATEQMQALASAISEVSDRLSQMAGQASEVTEQVTQIGGSAEEAAGTMESSSAEMVASLESVGEAADAAQAQVEASSVASEAAIEGIGATSEATAATMEAAGEASSVAFGPVGLALMALVTIGTLVVTHWKTVSRWLEDAWKAISSVATEVFGALVDFFVRIWDDIKNGVADAWDWVKDHLSVILPIILTIILGPIGTLVGLIATHWHQVEAITEEVWDDIKSFFSQVWDDITGVFRSVLSGIVSFMTSIWDTAKDIVVSAWDFIKDHIRLALVIILGIVTGGLAPVVLFIVDHWQQVERVTEEIWDDVKSFLGTVWGDIERGAEAVWGALKTFLSDTWNDIKSVATLVWDGIKDAVLVPIRLEIDGVIKVIDALKSAWQLGWDAIESVLNAVWSVIGPIISKIASGVSAVSHAIGTVSGIVGGVGHAAGSVIGSVGGFFSHLAVGGVVNHPQLAMIGEAGPEVVIPLNDKNRAAQLIQQSGLLRTLAGSVLSGYSTQVSGAQPFYTGAGSPAAASPSPSLLSSLSSLSSALSASASAADPALVPLNKIVSELDHMYTLEQQVEEAMRDVAQELGIPTRSTAQSSGAPVAATRAQTEQTELLRLIYEVLTSSGEIEKEQLTAQRQTTAAVTASASKIANGIDEQIDKGFAQVAQRSQRTVR